MKKEEEPLYRELKDVLNLLDNFARYALLYKQLNPDKTRENHPEICECFICDLKNSIKNRLERLSWSD